MRGIENVFAAVLLAGLATVAIAQPVETPAPPPTFESAQPEKPSEEIKVEVSSDQQPDKTKIAEAPPASNLGWKPIVVSYITGLQILLVPMIVGFIRTKLDKIPRIAIPIVAAAVGITADLVATQLAGGGFDVLRGALTGFLGQTLRELYNTFGQHRFKS